MSDTAQQASAGTPRDVTDFPTLWRTQTSRHWRLLLSIGLLMELVGIFSILVPIVASISVAVLAGWAILVGGVVQLAHAGRRDDGWERAWHLLLALITALVGLGILLFPLSGVITLTLLLVVWLFVTGGMRIAAWRRVRHVAGTWTTGLTGLGSVLLGIFIWASLPSSGVWAIGLLVGIEFLFGGSTAVMAGLEGRRQADSRAQE